MLRTLRQWFLRGGERSSKPPDLPVVPRDEAAGLWHRPDGLPRVDWEMAGHWIARREDGEMRTHEYRRAVMAACLDEVRDSLRIDHRRWSSLNVEGLAPLKGIVGKAMAGVAERSFRMLRKDLQRIRGDAPIPPIALVAIDPYDSYIDFTNSYFPEGGAYATSGGLYLNEGPRAFPLIALDGQTRFACETAVAHELTHHALHGCGLPAWVEEGFTQMMEERIAGTTNFTLNTEMIYRQREHWESHDVREFLEGSSFMSPTPDMQELSYHLAQWVVRGELSRHSDEFFRFARACRDEDPEAACEAILGLTARELVLGVIGIQD
jgi:hypothetical protein